MLDRHIRPYTDRPLAALAQVLIKMNVKADEITWVGFLLGLAACLAIAINYLGLALIFFILNRLMDGLDGAVARATKPTDFGAYLDVTLDFIVYAGLAFSFALTHPDHTLPAAFLAACFVVSSTSYLAHGFFALKHGEVPADHKYSALFSNGLMEGTESIFFFALFMLWPETFTWGAWLFGALCLLTAFGRLFAAHDRIKDQS